MRIQILFQIAFFAEAASSLLSLHLVGPAFPHQCTNKVYSLVFYFFLIVFPQSFYSYRTVHLFAGGDLVLLGGVQGAAPRHGRRHVRGLRLSRHDARPVRACAAPDAAAAGRAVLPAADAGPADAHRADDAGPGACEPTDARARLPARRAAAGGTHAAARRRRPYNDPLSSLRRSATGLWYRRLLHLISCSIR